MAAPRAGISAAHTATTIVFITSRFSWFLMLGKRGFNARRPLTWRPMSPPREAVGVDRQGRSMAWWTTPVRLSWTNTASRRFRRFQVGSIANGNRCVAGDLPSSSMNSYFVCRAGKRATSDLPAFSPDGMSVTTPSSRSTAQTRSGVFSARGDRLVTLIVAVPESPSLLRSRATSSRHGGFPGQGLADRRLGRGGVPAVDRLLAVDHQHRRVVEPVLGVLGPGVELVVGHLPLAVERVGEDVLPGVVEVIDVEGDRHDPPVLLGERAEDLLGRRAHVAALRRVELDEDHPLRCVPARLLAGGTLAEEGQRDDRDQEAAQDSHDGGLRCSRRPRTIERWPGASRVFESACRLPSGGSPWHLIVGRTAATLGRGAQPGEATHGFLSRPRSAASTSEGSALFR